MARSIPRDRRRSGRHPCDQFLQCAHRRLHCRCLARKNRSRHRRQPSLAYRRLVVAGEKLTLDGIKKQTLSAKQEPRIHFALNCATADCPPLNAAPSGEDLDRQQNFAAKSWLPDAGVFVDREAKTLTPSTIFNGYAPDFTNTDIEEIVSVDVRLQASIKYAAHYPPKHE